MKNLNILPLWLFLLVTSPVRAGWFNHDEQTITDYRQRLDHKEAELTEQRQSTVNWQLVAGTFAIGAIALFTIGTAIGSRCRSNIPSQPITPLSNGKRKTTLA